MRGRCFWGKMEKMLDYEASDLSRGFLGQSKVLTSGSCVRDVFVNGPFVGLLLREVDRFIMHYGEGSFSAIILHSDDIWDKMDESSETMSFEKEVHVSTKRMNDVVVQRKFCLQNTVMKSNFSGNDPKIKLIEDNVFFLRDGVVKHMHKSYHTSTEGNAMVLVSDVDGNKYVSRAATFDLHYYPKEGELLRECSG